MKLKTTMSVLCLLGVASVHAEAKLAETEHIAETVKLQPDNQIQLLKVFNVYGSIEVKGYDGNEIQVEAVNEVSADSVNSVNEGLREIGLKFEQVGNEYWIYLDSPFTYVDLETKKIWHSDTCWRHNDCSRKHAKKTYRYHMDIEVKVPRHMNLDVSAINNGDISINGIDAELLEVNNVNGYIQMQDVSGQTFAKTINKDIDIVYSANPSLDSEYGSINGDINISFAEQPDAEVVYQTMHGDIFTVYDVNMMASAVKKYSIKKEHGIQYKLDANSRFTIGQGGTKYHFETLNGDIKLQ